MRGLRWFYVVAYFLILSPAGAPAVQTDTPPKTLTTFYLSLNVASSATQTITLGNATAALTGPWKFHVGDDMEWAQPDYNDSSWGTMDLTPPPGSYDPNFGGGGFVPGWTARGYENYHGYAWYRLRVYIQSVHSALMLKMPADFDDAYQVYVNGHRVGEFGRFTAHGVTTYGAQPRAFSLPETMHSGTAIFAIRMWMDAYTPVVDPDAGGLHGPPVLGQSSAIVSQVQMDWDAIDRSQYARFFEMAILLLALLVTFTLYWLDRREPAYLWLGLTCAALLVENAVIALDFYAIWIPGVVDFLLPDAVLNPISIGLWVMFWAYWFRLSGMARLHRIVWSLVALQGAGVAMMRAPLYGTIVPVDAAIWLGPLTDVLHGLLGLLLIWIAVRGIRKSKEEGWIALPALALVGIAKFSDFLQDFSHVRTQYFLFGTEINIGLGQIGTILSLVMITVLLLRRFLYNQREREQWKLEIEHARQVQQVLIPQALPAVPGLRIESEYHPAQQVGGDFFQILEAPDGSLLIVLGDVTGHGLKAAMMVALIVGAIRNQTETSFGPLGMLQTLNRRLHGRGNIYATCLALLIAPDGGAALANAGHLPPYLNGEELPMEGALPLGMIADADFSLMNFRLEQSDRLILLTDGVVEATNTRRELFGFERLNAAIREKKSGAEIATEAQAFGQQDDITVIGIQFVGPPVGGAV